MNLPRAILSLTGATLLLLAFGILVAITYPTTAPMTTTQHWYLFGSIVLGAVSGILCLMESRNQ